MAHPAVPELDRDALKSIDNQIAQHFDAICALRRQRNAFMKVNRLPPEVLSRIFCFCVSPDSTKWVRKVCAISSYWRNLALAAPRLWSTPIFDEHCPGKAKLMLERAKNVPLTLQVSGKHITKSSLWPVFFSALSNPSRIRELSMSSTAALTANQMQELLSLAESAPYLAHLSFSSSQSLGFQPPPNASIPATFLNHVAPRLRTLRLEGINIHWDSTLMSPNITELALRHIAVGSVFELVSALGRMPQLETILLDDLLLSSGAVTSSSPNTLTPLIHLKSLHMATSFQSTADITFITDVLDRLSYPLDTKMTIRCQNGSSSEIVEDFARLLRNLPTVATSGSCRLCYLTIIGAFTCLGFRAWEHAIRSPKGRYMSCGSPLLDITIHTLPSNPRALEEMVSLLGKSLPIQDLRHVDACGHGLSSVRSWIRGGFGDFKSLESVWLRKDSVPAFISAAGEDVVLDGVKQVPQAAAVRLEPPRRRSRRLHPQLELLSGGLFFPALRYLEIQGVDLNDDLFGRLETMLMARCERMQEIRTLQLFECTHLSAYDVKLLGGIVVDVVRS